MDAVSKVASTFFDGVWKLLLKTDFPGIGVSIAGVMIAVLIIRFSIKVFQYITGFGANASDYGRVATGVDKIRSMKQKKND